MENARLLHEEPEQYSQMLEWDTAIHRAIWQIADEPSLTHYLEKLIWPYLVSSGKLEMAHGDQQSMLRKQIEREREGQRGSHRQVLEAICADSSSSVWRTHGLFKETADALDAAFPVAKI
jgi:hypothetical protein